MDALIRLGRSKGWVVEEHEEPAELPAVVAEFGVPEAHRDFLRRVSRCVAADGAAWLLCADDYAGARNSRYAWNAFEELSLRIARQDEDAHWAAAARAFWFDHLPVFMSVRSGYAYAALARGSASIVVGVEPEFERADVEAEDFEGFLAKLFEDDCTYF